MRVTESSDELWLRGYGFSTFALLGCVPERSLNTHTWISLVKLTTAPFRCVRGPHADVGLGAFRLAPWLC